MLKMRKIDKVFLNNNVDYIIIIILGHYLKLKNKLWLIWRWSYMSITRLELLRKNKKVSACSVSNLVTPRKDDKLSLDKCSKNTKFRSSAFDYMIR